MSDPRLSQGLRELALVLAALAALVFLLIRLYGADESHLMADMRRFRPISSSATGVPNPQPDAVAWLYQQMQIGISAQLPFRAIFQMDEHSRSGGTFAIEAEYAAPGDSNCMYLYVTRPLKQARLPNLNVDIVIAANGVIRKVPLDMLEGSRLVALENVPASNTGRIAVRITLVSRDPKTITRLTDTRIAVDYLHFEACAS